MQLLTPDTLLLERLAADAVRAPSSHNTQPWHVRWKGDAIELWADRTRALPVNDPDDRELVISCGCALLNLRISAAHEGFAATVTALPAPDEPDLLARVRLMPAAGAPADSALHTEIARRRTHRGAFRREAVPVAVLRDLEAGVLREGVALHVLTGESARTAAAELVEQGDAAQWGDPRWRRELAMWMHPRHRGDGLLMPGAIAPLVRLVVRTIDMGRSIGRRNRALASDAPALVALVTPGDTPRDWLQAGQALQRLLLTAVRHGLQASYLNQPIQVPALRPRMGAVIGHAGYPQLLLRLGVPVGRPAVSSRRLVREVFEVGGGVAARPV